MAHHRVEVIKRAGKEITKKFGRGAMAGAIVNIDIKSKTVISLNEKGTLYQHIVYTAHEVMHTALELATHRLRVKFEEEDEENIVEDMQELFENTLVKSGLKDMIQKLKYPKP